MRKHIRITKKRVTFENVLTEVILVILAIVWIAPLVNAVKLSLTGGGVNNYKTVLSFKLNNQLFLPRMFANSLLIVGTSIALILAITMLAAFAFSKMQFRWKKHLYAFVLAFYSIPVISILLPESTILRWIGLKDSYFAMIIPMVVINIPLALLIFKNYFDSIPNAYIEAAEIDGCTPFQVLGHVMLPLVTPAIVNVIVVTFLMTWNDYTIPLMFNNKQSHYALTLAPGFFNLALNKSEIGPLYACIIVIAIPTIIFYFIMQNKLKDGLTAGGLKE
jgi:raffinose/stachyose/melibiose transport system permease protein